MGSVYRKLKRMMSRNKKKQQFAEEMEPVSLKPLDPLEFFEDIPAGALCELFGIEKGKSIHAMHYSCEKCMNMQLIYLERGLEEHDENHKPVPFTIRCRKCGGMMKHVLWNDDVHLSKNADIPMGAYYFANLPQYKCGVVRQRGVDDIEEFEGKEVSEAISGT